MNLIKFLAMKLHQEPVFIDGMLNSTEVVVHSKTDFVKVVQNQLLFRKPLLGVRQLILQDRHVTYRETTLGISGTSIHSILHEHLTVKKFFSYWVLHNLSIAKKNGSIGRNKCSKNTIPVLRNTYMTL